MGKLNNARRKVVLKDAIAGFNSVGDCPGGGGGGPPPPGPDKNSGPDPWKDTPDNSVKDALSGRDSSGQERDARLADFGDTNQPLPHLELVHANPSFPEFNAAITTDTGIDGLGRPVTGTIMLPNRPQHLLGLGAANSLRGSGTPAVALQNSPTIARFLSPRTQSGPPDGSGSEGEPREKTTEEKLKDLGIDPDFGAELLIPFPANSGKAAGLASTNNDNPFDASKLKLGGCGPASWLVQFAKSHPESPAWFIQKIRNRIYIEDCFHKVLVDVDLVFYEAFFWPGPGFHSGLQVPFSGGKASTDIGEAKGIGKGADGRQKTADGYVMAAPEDNWSVTNLPNNTCGFQQYHAYTMMLPGDSLPAELQVDGKFAVNPNGPTYIVSDKGDASKNRAPINNPDLPKIDAEVSLERVLWKKWICCPPIFWWYAFAFARYLKGDYWESATDEQHLDAKGKLKPSSSHDGTDKLRDFWSRGK